MINKIKKWRDKKRREKLEKRLNLALKELYDERSKTTDQKQLMYVDGKIAHIRYRLLMIYTTGEMNKKETENARKKQIKCLRGR